MTPIQRNWAGNITYSSQNWLQPHSLEELQEQVQQAQKVRVVGTRHSFNHIADSPYTNIDVTGMDRISNLDLVHHTVTIEAGVRYGELAILLDKAEVALHNLASLPHISVGGAISTATHGSGVNNGNLSTAVIAMELVTADGSLLTLSQASDAERFAGAVVGLGAVGIISKLTLKIEPTYNIAQTVYLNLPHAVLETDFDAVMASGYSVSLFTDWRGESVNQVWVKRRIDAEKEVDAVVDDGAFFGAMPATNASHPITGVSPEYCTEQLGVVGAWYERLPHFQLRFTPSNGDELQSEYIVPREHALDAFHAIKSMGADIAPHLLTSEIRAIAADNLWLSSSYQRDSVAFHFTWKQEWDAVKPLLARIEAHLMPLNARPHWGKLFTMSHAYLKTQYPKWDDFIALLDDLDPHGKFRNPFINRAIFGVDA
ncbi:MAG: FAD-binding protein [Aggregatilineales bacterium]